jgi:hypothetical protein
MAAYLAIAPLLLAVAGGGETVAQGAPRPVADHRSVSTQHTRAAAVVQSAWASTNWSGYAESGTYTGITSTWTVPAVTPSSSPTYSSTWIGIDGFNNSSLIQAGTEQDYLAGASRIYAWWEILPSPQTPLPTTTYPVSAGDRMSVEIYKATTLKQWVIAVADTTRKWSFQVDKTYTGPGSSAEWIMEAPEVNGQVSTLARYTVNAPAGKADFDNVGVTSAAPRTSAVPTFGSARLAYSQDAGYMVQNKAAVSTPGSPDAALSGFNIAYGAQPAPTPAA